MRLLGILLIIISATSFGAMPIFAHFAYASGATPLTVLFFRFAIASVCLCSYLAVWRVPLPSSKNLRTLLFLGGVGFVLQSLSFFTALTLASPSVVVLLLYLYPTIVVGISIVLLHKPSNPAKLIALAVALVGLVLTISPTGKSQELGIVLGLVSASVYAIYVVMGEQVLQQEAPITACAVMISAAAVVYGVIVTLKGISLPVAPSGWLAIMAIALISTVLAISTLFAGIKLLGATTASMLSTLEPVVTTLLSMLIFKESVTGIQFIGGGLILTAVIVLAVQENNKRLGSSISLN